MKPWQTEVSRWMFFLIEMTFVYLIIYALYIFEGTAAYLIPFMIICIVSACTYRLIVGKTKSVKYTAAAVPFIFLLGMILGFEYYLAALLSVILFWRVLTLYEESEQDHDLKLFSFTFGFGLLFYLLFYQVDSNYFFIVIIFTQFLFVLLYKAVHAIFKTSKENERSSSYLKWLIGTIIGLGSISVFLGMLSPVVKALFLSIVGLIVQLSYVVSRPILYSFGLIGREDEGGASDESEQIYDGYGEFIEEMRQTNVDDTFIGSMMFYWIVLSILLIIAFIYIIKMKWRFKNEDEAKESSTDSAIEPVHTPHFIEKIKNRFLSNNEVRKLLYELEVNCAKHGYGRRYSETLAEWMFRLPVENTVKHIILHTYQSVRYADKKISTSDRNKYKEAIKIAKKQLKDAS
ncbi:hypothetical protein [Evansella halocellulosilytica]|uniref:hypothetical protein n=1 Tax=Evansella halocellulosilytica TaxID=2011013 RepID=UPI000BB785B8|nr:hypothetical protein [Evansella halocellulosilytica]